MVQLVNGGKRGRGRACSIIPRSAPSASSARLPLARYIYSRAAANGKRAQCQGGAKNPVVVMPDADMEMTTRILADSRVRLRRAALPGRLGRDHRRRRAQALHASDRRGRRATRKVGYGLDSGVEMGPVISAESKSAHRGADRQGRAAKARDVLVDGRGAKVQRL